jgi:hypothetical protein
VSIPAAPSYPMVPGEDPGTRITRIVRQYDGASAHVRRAELAALVCRGVDDERLVDVSTNCATFALGIFAAAGVDHPILKAPYVIGTAVTDVLAIARDKGALRTVFADGAPPPGAACHFGTPTLNNDHIEFALNGAHGGGGRPGNAVSVVASPLNWPDGYGRQLLHWVDPDAFGIGTLRVDELPHPASDAVPPTPRDPSVA